MDEPARHLERQYTILVRWLPYALAVASLAAASFSAPALGRADSLLPAGGLILVAVAWHWYAVDRRWGVSLDDGTGRAYVTGRTTIAFAASWWHPFFSIFALAGYLDAHRYLRPRGAVVVLVVTAVTMAGAQSGGLPPTSTTQAGALAGLFALHTGIVLFLHRVTRDEAALVAVRDETIAQLASTNRRLATAIAENEELQARFVEQAREAGVRGERERLALEIHDTIAQDLIGIITQLDAAAAASDPAAGRRHHDRAALLARAALTEARRSLDGLTPARLSDATLPEALGQMVAEWAERTGIDANLVLDGPAAPLHRDVEETVLRVAQEALSNAARHASARRVGVTLSYIGDQVALDVRDDGVGFDPEAVSWRSVGGWPAVGAVRHGIIGMQQRARRVAGRVVIESEPGAGAAVSLQVPAVPARLGASRRCPEEGRDA